MRLPPPGTKPEDLIAYMDSLEDECYRDPNRAAWHLNKQRWLDLYTGNHFADPLVSAGVAAQSLEPEQLSPRAKVAHACKLVYNRVMNAVLAMLAGQISNPPKVVFGARENGEPPITYLNGFVQNPLLAPIAVAAGAQDERVQELATIYGVGHPQVQDAAQQVGNSVPLTPDLVQKVQALIDQGKMAQIQARMANMPPPQGIVPPEALIEITDQSTAQFTQTIFDGLWEQCGGIEVSAENILNKKVMGWAPTLFESDRSKIANGDSPITLTNVEGAQVFFDPMTSSFRPPRYVIMKEPVSYEEAIAKFPDLDIAGKLQEKFRQGTLNYRARDGTQTSRLFYLQYARDMAVVRTMWIMDWPYPMDPDEAVASGLLQIGQVPIEQPQTTNGVGNNPQQTGYNSGTDALRAGSAQGQPSNPNPSTDPNSGVGPSDSGISGGSQTDQSPIPQPPTADGTGPTDQNPAGGAAGGQSNVPNNAIGGIQASPPMRQAFIHSDTGQEVTPTLPDGTKHPLWPTIFAIREICEIETEVVYDRRCKLKQIPVVNNVNIPIPFSPYGYGEPDRLDGLQMAINKVLSDLVEKHRYNTYPVEVVSQTLANDNRQAIRSGTMKPNTVIIASQQAMNECGGDLSKLIQFVEMPSMSQDAWQLLEFLVDAIDKEANNTDVQNGDAPAGSSGAWVANLQAAAAQVAQVTSQATEAWLKKLVRLFVAFIVNEMTIEDVMKYTSKYPPAILQAFQKHQKALYYDITVEIQSGSAATKQGQTGAMMQAKAQGLPISDPTIMDRMNLDPDAELQAQATWQDKMRQAGLVPVEAQQGAANNSPEGQQAGQPA